MKELVVGAALLGTALWGARGGGRSFGDVEDNILYETKNLYLYRTRKGLEMRLNSGSGSIVVGKPKDEESGRRFMDRAERDGAKNLKRMYGVL